jgi:hypothetical protein
MTTGIINAKHSGSATCAVCCKLPNGLILEAGWIMTPNSVGVSKGPNYKRVVLAGSNAATIQNAKANNLIPVSSGVTRAGITINVDEAFFDAWVKAHPNSNIVKNRQIWKAKNLAEAQTMVELDAARKNGWESRNREEANPKGSQFEIKQLERET